MISFSKYKKVVLIGSGTGGHVTPIVAIVHEHRNVNIEYLWIGGKDSLEETTAKKERIPFQTISILRLSSIFSPKVILYPFFLLKGVFQVRAILLKEKPDIIFSKGGPGSVSVGIASWLLMIPLWIHESDTIPGWSNRFLGKIAERIFLGFDTARRYFDGTKCTVTGQIIDPDIHKKDKNYRYWKTDKHHILVICGSQGSRNVFRAISENCRYMNVEWIVLLGRLNKEARSLFNGFQNITLYDWIDVQTLGAILDGTDLTITRGSATSLAEIDLFRKKKIIVPLPWSSQNHQYHNALWYKSNRNDVVLEESALKNSLQKTINAVLAEEKISKTMNQRYDFLG